VSSVLTRALFQFREFDSGTHKLSIYHGYVDEGPMSDIREERNKVAARRRFEARLVLDELKSRPCEDCKGKFHPCQMDFWRDPGPGVHIARRTQMSRSRILEEASRCKIICSNCHRLRTWRAQRAARSGPT
jgi:hypothetical protein